MYQFLQNLRSRRAGSDSASLYLSTKFFVLNQLPCIFDESKCFGIVANMEFILVCTYEENGENPELVIYKKR